MKVDAPLHKSCSIAVWILFQQNIKRETVAFIPEYKNSN